MITDHRPIESYWPWMYFFTVYDNNTSMVSTHDNGSLLKIEKVLPSSLWQTGRSSQVTTFDNPLTKQSADEMCYWMNTTTAINVLILHKWTQVTQRKLKSSCFLTLCTKLFCTESRKYIMYIKKKWIYWVCAVGRKVCKSKRTM